MGSRKQRGVSIIGFLMLMSLVGFFAYIGMQLYPMYHEYYSVVSSMEKVRDQPGIAQQNPDQVIRALQRYFDTSYVSTVERQHITVVRRGTYTLKVEYEVRKPLFGNLEIVGVFKKEVELNARDRG